MNRRKQVAVACLGAVVGMTGLARGDVITEWDAVYRDVIRAVGGGPCPVGRAQAMLHTSMYDAVNSIDQKHTPYLTYMPTTTADMKCAAAQAAHDVLSALYPGLKSSMFAPKLAAQLATVPDGPAKTEGIALGAACAAACIAARTGDGSTDMTPYVPSMAPGQWRPWPGQPHHGSNWWKVKPFCVPSAEYFETPMPLDMTSAEYAAEFNEVKIMGCLGCPARTADQTEIGHFWGNDRDRTYKPPGHLTYITQVLSEQNGLTTPQNARLFALVSLGMADSVLVAWTAKYGTSVDLWRPVDAIRRGDEDGNPATVKDPLWTTQSDMTPPFPAFMSGHSIMGAQHAAIMERFFGTDEMTFTIGTDDPFVPLGTTRTYHRFSDAAWENALSRIYLGVHWRQDVYWGNKQGYRVGEYVYAYFLRPICRADLNDDGIADFSDYLYFLNVFESGDLQADYTGDHIVDFSDYLEFLNAFDEGCG